MFKILSILLSYPQPFWLDEINTLAAEAARYPQLAVTLEPVFAYLRQHDEIALQEAYVDTFDRSRKHALHLFEHLHGEDKARGQAMVDLLHEYQQCGFEPKGHELPDYLPLFLEFLSMLPEQQAQALLADAVHVIAYVGGNLRQSHSVYAQVCDALVMCAPIPPQPLQVAPVRDMDEAMTLFGPSAEGIEPLLQPTSTHTMRFYAHKPRS